MRPESRVKLQQRFSRPSILDENFSADTRREAGVSARMGRPIGTVLEWRAVYPNQLASSARSCGEAPRLSRLHAEGDHRSGRGLLESSLGNLVNWIMTDQDFTIHQLQDYISGKYPA
jgi:hypothetical protein